MHHSSEERNAVRAMLRRAAVVSSSDGGAQQLLALSGLASEQLTNIVHVQPFGLSSNPPVGGEGLIVCLGGRSDRAMFLGGEHPQAAEFRDRQHHRL
jgi:phage gp45-like